MSDSTVVETVYGKHSKYEVIMEGGGLFGSPKYYVYKDGKPFKGSYSSLSDAVEAARDAG